MTTAHVNRIGTANPPHDVHDAFIALGRGMLQDDKARLAFDRLAERAAISHRWSHFQPGAPGAAEVERQAATCGSTCSASSWSWCSSSPIGQKCTRRQPASL